MTDNELVFDRVIESNDGADGEVVFEISTTIERLMELISDGHLVVGNIRPDHAIVTTTRGERFKRRSDRQKSWTDKLSHGKGVLGNLSWNVDPDHHNIEWDDDAGRLFIRPRTGAIKIRDSGFGHEASSNHGCLERAPSDDQSAPARIGSHLDGFPNS